jgi:hypothetical protein
MSWVALREEDMWNGEMEKRVIEGTAHIVDKMEKKPRCILIYLSCMHMFEGCDFMMITDELHEMYPDIDFVECYMIPTMRKTMSPDAMMKISLYEAVEKLEKDESLVGIIGSSLPNAKDSDLVSLIEFAALLAVDPVLPETVVAQHWEVVIVEFGQFLRIGSDTILAQAKIIGLPEEYFDLLAAQRCLNGIIGRRPGLHIAAHVVACDAVVPVELQRREAGVTEAGAYVEYVDLPRLFKFDRVIPGVTI